MDSSLNSKLSQKEMAQEIRNLSLEMAENSLLSNKKPAFGPISPANMPKALLAHPIIDDELSEDSSSETATSALDDRSSDEDTTPSDSADVSDDEDNASYSLGSSPIVDGPQWPLMNRKNSEVQGAVIPGVKSLDASSLLSKTGRLLDIIHAPVMPVEDRDSFVVESLQMWKDHVNPGFLQYRKSVSNGSGFAVMEWSDNDPKTGLPGKGLSVFYDVHGTPYIDCLGAYGVYNCGHRNPKIVAAVKAQLDKQCLHSQELLDPLRAHCAALTSALTDHALPFAFFTSSGTESVESCLKMAMLATGRKHFVGAVGAFHGKTLGSLAATSKAQFRSPFLPLLNFTHVPFDDIEALRSVLHCARFTGNEVAGVMLEPIQGEGGINVPGSNYLPQVRKLCDEYGCMMILDEVQTGMGRSGRMFAYQHYVDEATGELTAVPDLLAIGKAFGGGVMPVGACLGSARAWEKYNANPFLHTSTFGGNPLACAAAIAGIHVLVEENLVQQAEQKGNYLKAAIQQVLKEYPQVLKEVRGQGMLIGMEFHNNEIGYIISKGMFSRRVLIAGTLVNSKTIRVEPPLTIEYDQMDEVVKALRESCADLVRDHPQLLAAVASPSKV